MTRPKPSSKNWIFDLVLIVLAGLLLGLVIFLPFLAFYRPHKRGAISIVASSLDDLQRTFMKMENR